MPGPDAAELAPQKQASATNVSRAAERMLHEGGTGSPSVPP